MGALRHKPGIAYSALMTPLGRPNVQKAVPCAEQYFGEQSKLIGFAGNSQGEPDFENRPTSAMMFCAVCQAARFAVSRSIGCRTAGGCGFLRLTRGTNVVLTSVTVRPLDSARSA